MRIAQVVGTVTLSRGVVNVKGHRWTLVVPLDLKNIADGTAGSAEEIVAIDDIGAGPGDRVAIAEGMEACFPYYPAKMPIDCYIAAILDDVTIDRQLTESLK